MTQYELYFYGYVDREGWEIIDIVREARGGTWKDNTPSPHFSFEGGIPTGVFTILNVANLPYGLKTIDSSKWRVKWSLHQRNTLIHSIHLMPYRSPAKHHPLWEKVLSGHCGIIESAHHALALKQQGIPVDL